MNADKLLFIALLLISFPGFLFPGEFEDIIYGLDDLPETGTEAAGPVFKQLAVLDPGCDTSYRILNRIFSPDVSGLKKLLGNLDHQDYSVRSETANRILTYSLKDIQDILVKEELGAESPEKLFQTARIDHELKNHYYRYRRRVVTVRNNLLFYLAYSSDTRFFSFARKLYSEGSLNDKHTVISLAGYFDGAEKANFLADIFARTNGVLTYKLFTEIHRELSISEVRGIARAIVENRQLPLLLRASAAASIKNAGISIEGYTGEDPFLRMILETDASVSNRDLSKRASAELRSFPPSEISSTYWTGCRGWITGIDLSGGITCDTGNKLRSIPLYRAQKITFVPSGRRRNMDYVCRVVLHNGNSLSGTPIQVNPERIVIENSYIRGRIPIDPARTACIQFNTENSGVPSVKINSFDVPRIHLENGDSFSGHIIKQKGKKPAVRFSGLTVSTDPGSRPVDTLYIDIKQIRRVDFPVKRFKSPSGFCSVTTLYGDTLSGNFMKMDSRYCVLYSELFGTLRIKRNKIRQVSLDSGFSVFMEHAVMTFPLQDMVCVYDLQGQNIWKKTGLKKPVYAERLPNGDICICERLNGTISIYSKEYLLKSELKGFSQVSAVHALSNGNLLISCERAVDPVLEINRTGTRVRTYNGLKDVTDAVQRPDLTVVAVSMTRSKLALLTPRGGDALKERYIGTPVSVQLLENENILVCSRASISEYTGSLSKNRETEITRFSRPRAFRYGGSTYCIDGNILYKLDSGNNVIQKVVLPAKPESLFMY